MDMKITLIISDCPLSRIPITVPKGVADAKIKMNYTILENGILLFCIAIEIDMASANL